MFKRLPMPGLILWAGSHNDIGCQNFPAKHNALMHLSLKPSCFTDCTSNRHKYLHPRTPDHTSKLTRTWRRKIGRELAKIAGLDKSSNVLFSPRLIPIFPNTVYAWWLCHKGHEQTENTVHLGCPASQGRKFVRLFNSSTNQWMIKMQKKSSSYNEPWIGCTVQLHDVMGLKLVSCCGLDS